METQSHEILTADHAVHAARHRIRASLLPSYNDCPRRAAASILYRSLQNMGYELRQRVPLVSGSIGTAIHAVQKMALTDKCAGRNIAKLAAVDFGISEFDRETAAGTEWDETTPQKNNAEKQIQTMAACLFEEIIPAIEPRHDAGGNPVLEYSRAAMISDSFELAGSLDYESLSGTDTHIGDTKTGKHGSGYEAQLGAYSLLKKSNDASGAAALFVEHLPRTSIKKPYPGSERHSYNLALSERLAWHTCKQIMRDVMNFEASQSPWVFPTNRMSQLCSPKYCQAHGTAWCELTQVGAE